MAKFQQDHEDTSSLEGKPCASHIPSLKTGRLLFFTCPWRYPAQSTVRLSRNNHACVEVCSSGSEVVPRSTTFFLSCSGPSSPLMRTRKISRPELPNTSVATERPSFTAPTPRYADNFSCSCVGGRSPRSKYQLQLHP